ncbi:hypothetical protein L195_g060656 [Trifolium pratense]|uniref:Uncharacterized protein n=1 Tax=Trifolium pratense TaxID=57577 RepID=A0A2K3K581_TRIPR|nr:hypothetical protein L195_g060656 [Trifolium pratense]
MLKHQFKHQSQPFEFHPELWSGDTIVVHNSCKGTQEDQPSVVDQPSIPNHPYMHGPAYYTSQEISSNVQTSCMTLRCWMPFFCTYRGDSLYQVSGEVFKNNGNN